MDKFKFIKTAIITFITILVLAFTNTIWLKRKPVDIDLDIIGKGKAVWFVKIGKKQVQRESDLDKNEHIHLVMNKKGSFNRINFILKINKDKNPRIEISNVNLRNGKIKLDDLKKFEVKGAQKDIVDDKLVLTPDSDRITLSYSIAGNPAMIFQIWWFLLFLILSVLIPEILLTNTILSYINEKFINFKNKLNFDNMLPAIIAFSFSWITNILDMDKLFFDNDITVDHKIFIKILFLILSTIAWYFIFYVGREYKKGNPLFKRGVHLFAGYFGLMMILMLILWPGTWLWDDIVTLTHDFQYHYQPWQHILTSIEHLLFLQILPFPAGIIIIQNLCVSALAAFIIVKLETSYNLYKELLDLFLKFAPFLLIPQLRYQFSGYRLGISTYFEIAALVMLLCAIQCKEKWDNIYFLFFTVISAMAINWRSENIFYLPIFLVLIIILKSLGSNKKRTAFAFLLCLFTFGINTFQNISLANDNYEIMSTVSPLVEIIRVADKEKYQHQLNIIDKVIKIDVVYKYSNIRGEQLFWKKNLVRKYKPKEYKNYLYQYMFLITKYPNTFIKERYKVYKYSMRGGGFWITLYSESKKLFLSDRWILNKQIFPYLRYKLIKYMQVKPIYNHAVPEIFLVIFSIFLLLTKHYKELLLTISVLIKIPIIFATEPIGWLMYWLPLYVIGYLVFYYSILYLISRREAKCA